MSSLFSFSFNRSVVIPSINLALFVTLVFFASASNADNGTNQESLQNFAKTLNTIENNLKRNRYSEDEIPKTTKQVTPIKLAASQCILDESANIKKLNIDLDSLGKLTKVEPEDVKQKRYELNDKILKAEKLLASCRVFVLRSEEILKNLSDEQQRLLSARLFAKSADIKYLIIENWNKATLWLKATKLFLLNNTGINRLSTTNILVLIFVILLSFTVSLIVRKQICKHISKKMMHDTFSNYFARSFLAVSAFYTPHLFVSLSAAIFFYTITSTVSPVHACRNH